MEYSKMLMWVLKKPLKHGVCKKDSAWNPSRHILVSVINIARLMNI